MLRHSHTVVPRKIVNDNERLRFICRISYANPEADAFSTTASAVEALANAEYIIEVERLLSTLSREKALSHPRTEDLLPPGAITHCRYFVPVEEDGKEKYIEMHVKDIFEHNPFLEKDDTYYETFYCLDSRNQPPRGCELKRVWKMDNPKEGKSIGVPRPVDRKWRVGGLVLNWGDLDDGA